MVLIDSHDNVGDNAEVSGEGDNDVSDGGHDDASDVTNGDGDNDSDGGGNDDVVDAGDAINGDVGVIFLYQD